MARGTSVVMALIVDRFNVLAQGRAACGASPAAALGASGRSHARTSLAASARERSESAADKLRWAEARRGRYFLEDCKRRTGCVKRLIVGFAHRFSRRIANLAFPYGGSAGRAESTPSRVAYRGRRGTMRLPTEICTASPF